MSDRYSAEWVRDQARGATQLDHHSCGMCHYMTRYVFRGEDVSFDAGCDCARWAPWRPSSFQDIAEWLAMQRSDEVRDRIMAGLRIPVESSADSPSGEAVSASAPATDDSQS